MRPRVRLCFGGLLARIAATVIASGCLARAADTPAPVDHILLEVKDLDQSIHFYQTIAGVQVKSRSADFVTLESGNIGIFLWSNHWDWETAAVPGQRRGFGMYPHFQVTDIAAVIAKARTNNYQVVQDVRKYGWGSEAFVADPDGYVWALVEPAQSK